MIVHHSEPKGFQFTAGPKGDICLLYAPREIAISAAAVAAGRIFLNNEQATHPLPFTVEEGQFTFADDFGKSYKYQVVGANMNQNGIFYCLERVSSLPRMTDAEKTAEQAEALMKARAAGSDWQPPKPDTDGVEFFTTEELEATGSAPSETRDYFAERVQAAAEAEDDELIVLDLNEEVTVAYPGYSVVFRGVTDAYLEDGALVIEGEEEEMFFPAPGWLYWSSKPVV
jgi:hypothetical protein